MKAKLKLAAGRDWLARLVRIHGVPDGVEALYPNWHHNDGENSKRLDQPSAYRNSEGKVPSGMGVQSDFIWAWVLHPDLRQECTRAARTRAEKAIRARFGDAVKKCYFRPPGWGFSKTNNVSPVRIWTGRKWTWFWVIPNYCLTPTKVGRTA
jgi:hypothetical protein